MTSALFVVGFAGLIMGWLMDDPSSGLLRWATSYAGETAVGDSSAYGIRGGGLLALATAGARAIYGAALAVVDVSSVTKVVRGAETMDVRAVASVLALLLGLAAFALAALSAMSSNERRGAVALIMGWFVGVLAFGLYFNNSDDQFFVQLSVPLGVLATATPLKDRRLRSLGFAALCVVSWNVIYVWSTLVMYPREVRLDELSQSVDGAELVVYPGFDEPERLLHLLPDSLYGARWSLMELAARYNAQQGLAILSDSIEHVVERGGEVRLINIIGAHSGQHPWTALRIRGYESSIIAKRLKEMKYPIVARPACAFTLWTIGGSAGWTEHARCPDER